MKTLLFAVTLCAMLVTALSAQTPDFSPNHDVRICGPDNVYFVLTSPQNPQNTWWDFGDGTTGIGLTPTHFYTTTGVYDVKLVVERNGIKDSIIKIGFVTVAPAPEARFEPTTQQIHEPFKREFKFTGFSNSDGISNYEWKINDTAVASTQDLVYVFPRSDWFVVSLNIENNEGCKDLVTDSVFISGEDVELGLQEKLFRNDFAIGLTPDQHQLTIKRKSGQSESLSYVLYDITGRVELQGVLNAGEPDWTIDVSSLHYGVHLIIVNNKSYKAVKRLQKYMQ